MNRRHFLHRAAVTGGAIAFPALSFGLSGIARAQSGKLRVGIALPVSGSFAPITPSIMGGWNLAIKEAGNRAAGREIEIISIDDKADTANAINVIDRLARYYKVDVVMGTISSSVQIGFHKYMRETGVEIVNLIPVAGAGVISNKLCSMNVFRFSQANAQNGLATGEAVGQILPKSLAAYIAWDYQAGNENVFGFTKAYATRGGETIPFRIPVFSYDFSPVFDKAMEKGVKILSGFVAVEGARRFILQYRAHPISKVCRLVGPGEFVATSLARLDEAQGVSGVSFYSAAVENPFNQRFVADYSAANGGKLPDQYAIAGYECGVGLTKATAKLADWHLRTVVPAMEAYAFNDSPRGAWRFDKAHNPIQNYYMMRVADKSLKVDLTIPKVVDPGMPSGDSCPLK
jgi:branched-chain amino acid transport system substrate-binding protein